MYYTITLNPAVDMLTKASNFSLGKLNRTQEAKYVVGGKGINISILLNNIGEKTKALGFVAGFTGYFIKSELDKLDIEHDFVETLGTTRINMKLTTDTETEINGQSSCGKLRKYLRIFCKTRCFDDRRCSFLIRKCYCRNGTRRFQKNC